MPERSDFWKGVVTGTLVGMAIAIYAKWDLDRLAEEVPGFTENDLGLQPDISTKPVSSPLKGVAEVLSFRQATARGISSRPTS